MRTATALLLLGLHSVVQQFMSPLLLPRSCTSPRVSQGQLSVFISPDSKIPKVRAEARECTDPFYSEITMLFCPKALPGV